MQVTILRSKEFCRASCVADGLDHPQFLTIDVDPSSLTEEARNAIVPLMQVCGIWPPSLSKIGYKKDGQLTWGYAGWGAEEFLLDSDSPTAEELSAAIIDAVHRAGKTARARERLDKLRADKSAIEAEIAQILAGTLAGIQ